MLEIFRRRPRGERGAVAVEAALVTPLIIAILLGIIELTLLLKDNVAVSTAVRAGARTASAQPRQDAFLANTATRMDRAVASLNSDGLQEMWVYKANDAGYPTGTSGFTSCGSNCVKFTWDGTEFTTVEANKWPASSVNACPEDPALNPSGPDSVGVYLVYKHSFITGIFGQTMTLTDHAVLNFEPVPPTQGCKP
jgi:TadE-like protein